ncbi:MAG: hypothetical protein V1866_07320 [archaeon]
MRKDAELKKTIDEFIELTEKYKDTLIIVEGVNDRRALTELGFSRIMTLNRPLYAVVESIEEKRVVILTDLDSEGKKLYRKLKSTLSERGIFVDDKLRNLLSKTELKQIEGLGGYLKRFAE